MAGMPVPMGMPAAVGRSLAARLREHAARVAADWADRHRAYPCYVEAALEELGDWRAYADRFARPALAVLALALETGQERYGHIYANERLRFASVAGEAEARQAELTAMVAADEAAIGGILGLGDASPEAALLRATLHGAHGLLVATGRPVRVAMVGDCVMTDVQSFLRPRLAAAGLHLTGRHFYFSARLGAALDADELLAAMAKQRADLIALSFLTFEGLPLYTALLKEADRLDATTRAARCDALLGLIDGYIRAIREKVDTPILLHGCSGLPIARWRRYLPIVPPMSRAERDVVRQLDLGLEAMADGIENVIFIDERALVEPEGLRAADRRLLPRRLTHGALFHPNRFGMMMAGEYARVIEAYAVLAGTKVLLVDFDNTLWKGVMADGPVEHDIPAQTLLKQLQEAGILLVSVSKNSEANIRWDEMVLKPDDFVLHKISWDLKAQSVIDIAGQLNLDPASFVLIDDNPAERALVTSTVPGVRALDPLDPACWRALALLHRFPATRQTDEARRRTAMYREAAARREATSATLDYATMMRSLSLRIGWRRAVAGDLDRLNELVNRTNQFNTTTRRYTAAEIAGLIGDAERDVFVASLSDRFGSLGIVGAAITRMEEDALHYETIVMSCRAMGFGLESQLVWGPMAARPAARRAVGRYIPTPRNGPCADLFSRHGFIESAPGHWVRAIDGPPPALPEWLDLADA